MQVRWKFARSGRGRLVPESLLRLTSYAEKSEDGSILVMTALSLVAMIVILGFAIDVGHVRLVQRNLQRAADAAAVAAALEDRHCTNASDCSTMQSAAQSALTENGMTATSTLTNCSGTAGDGITMTLNDPPCEISTDPNQGKSNYAEVVLSQKVPAFFASMVGVPNFTVTARAEAARGTSGPCIYALDPSGPAITILAGVIVTSRCPVVDESASSDALTCVVGAFLYAPRISVTGDDAGLLCLAHSQPQTHVPVPTPADPLGYLSAPSNANASCGTSTTSPYFGSSSAVNVGLTGNAVFNPGVYCGGISITASVLSNITFNPGTYILRDSTGFLGITTGGLNMTLSALSNISGSGVTFYNEGPTRGFTVAEPVSGGSIVSLSNISLSAPTSGNYQGILFFQAHGTTAPALFLANLVSSSKLEGAIYVPDGSVNYGVSAISSAYNILVAKDINLTVAVASSFGNDYSSLQNGSPIQGNDVALVQ
jgi:Putative Flp pilus-assembly TadE/G-like